MLIEKYKPKNLKDIVGQKNVIERIRTWIKNPEKPLLLYGPPGCGKTSIAYALAKESNLDIIEVNASDKRNAESLQSILLPALTQSSLFRKGKLILIDEIDGISGSDRGAISTLVKILKKSRYPVIITANDIWLPKLAPLRKVCEKIQLKKINTLTLEKKLREISRKEDLSLSENDIKILARYASGDMRSALLDMDKFKSPDELGWREREVDIFNILKVIFKSKSPKTALDAIRNSDKTPDEIFWWVEENIANEFSAPEEIARAYDVLARADIFRSMIRKRQNYRFLYYMLSLLSGIGSAQKDRKIKFISYRPPSRFLFLKKRKDNAEEKEYIERLARELHCSKKKIKAQLPILRIITN